MELSRRIFLAGAASGAASVAATSSAFGATGLFQDRTKIRIGLIGCGGRGSGALRDSLNAEEGAVVWAMGDLFADRLNGSVASLKKELPNRTQLDGRIFGGWNAYKAVIESGVDVVILATPPAFRPIHFAAAVEAGKHVFMEKPVAVDGPGIRMVMEAAKKAKEKNLSVVAGTQRRHDVAYNECIKRIRDGQMGDIVQMNCYWNQGGLWRNDRQPDWSDMEWQLRNWLYFAWLSGDHITEQHVHNIDVCNWAKGEHPVKAISMGGRQSRTDAAYGHIFDHFATEYHYADGTKMISWCRQIDNCVNNVSEQILGTKGKSDANNRITGEKEWKWEGQRRNPYVLEHVRLYKSIKNSEGFNEGVQVAESTLTAIMGRMSAYSGQEVTWEAALNSKVSLGPDQLAFGDVPVAPVAIPGAAKNVF